MAGDMGIALKLEIDDSRVIIITRAQRLSGVVLAWLSEAQKTLQQQNPDATLPPELAESIAWLEEMRK